MTAEMMTANAPVDSVSKRREQLADWAVRLIQFLFVVVVLLDLDGPFVSAHNERQNQSFDMARHVWRDGWSSVITPKVSYVYAGYESRHYMAALQEVPFNGLLAWPLAHVTRHERAVARLISTAFSLLAIQFLYLILCHWLSPVASVLGTAVWAMAPMILQFGQTPMPDILCTTGMLAAFWFSLRGKLPASSGCFLFAVLAKLSIIVFGLPILVALLVYRQCRSAGDFFRLSIAWGWLPLLGLVLWMWTLGHFAPPTPMTIGQIISDRGTWANLVRLSFYKNLLGSLFPFGVGVLGFLGLLLAVKSRSKINSQIKWAVIAANAVFLVCIFRKVPEPQYTVPVLAWFAFGAAFGFDHLAGKLRGRMIWKTALGAALILHILVAVAFTVDLKTSRVPSYADIERAGKLLPPDARVIVLYRYYGAGPAVWLDRNVMPMGVMDSLKYWPEFRREGFTHMLVLDIESLHDARSDDSPQAWVSRILQATGKSAQSNEVNLGTYTNPNGPYRQYCDAHFTPLFDAPHVILYSIPAAPESAAKN